MGDPGVLAVWLIVLPLVWASSTFVFAEKYAAWTAIAGLAVQAALSLHLAGIVMESGPGVHQAG